MRLSGAQKNCIEKSVTLNENLSQIKFIYIGFPQYILFQNSFTEKRAL